MEHGTENILLNKAYNTMKQEQLPWLENIRCFLSKIGLNNIWQNPDKRSIFCVKKCVKERLNDIHLQKYHEYLSDIKNMHKCEIAKLCKPDQYLFNEYLNNVKNPTVRSSITKLRIDANNTLDCKKRSFRYRSVVNDLCDRCNVSDTVQHRLLHCAKTSTVRNNFNREVCQYSAGYNILSDSGKLQVILSANPYCETDEIKSKMVNAIVKFIKEIYHQ